MFAPHSILARLMFLTACMFAAGLAQFPLTTHAASWADLPFSVVTSLTLDPSNPSVGQPVTARFTMRNDGPNPVTVARIGAGGRGPGCADFTCTDYQDFPLIASVTIGPGQTYNYEQQRTFTSAGAYFFQITYEAPSSAWHFLGSRMDLTIGRGLEISHPLMLTPTGPSTKDIVLAEFELTNVGTATLHFPKIGLGLRGPNCTPGDWDCSKRPDYPFLENVTLGPGERIGFRDWRIFRDDGQYFAQVSVQDNASTWSLMGSRHDFAVITAGYVQRTTPVRFGVQWHPTWERTKDDTELALAASLGAQVIRIGPSWRLLEPSGKGQWDLAYVAKLDHLISEARRLGIEPYLMLLQVPCWASSDPAKNCALGVWDDAYPPTSVHDYADAVRKLVNLYGDRVAVWEVWNEPNIARFWKPAPDAAAYTRLLQEASAAIKAAQPHAVVLGGSLAGADYRFLDAMYAAGAARSFDALALHPYSAGQPADCTDMQWSYACGIDGIRSQMLQAGDDSPIWLTEFGWATYGSLTEAIQRDYLMSALVELEKRPYVEAVSWYTLVNTNFEDLPLELAQDNDFGLFYQDHRPKLAAQWLQARQVVEKLFMPALRK